MSISDLLFSIVMAVVYSLSETFLLIFASAEKSKTICSLSDLNRGLFPSEI